MAERLLSNFSSGRLVSPIFHLRWLKGSAASWHASSMQQKKLSLVFYSCSCWLLPSRVNGWFFRLVACFWFCFDDVWHHYVIMAIAYVTADGRALRPGVTQAASKKKSLSHARIFSQEIIDLYHFNPNPKFLACQLGFDCPSMCRLSVHLYITIFASCNTWDECLVRIHSLNLGHRCYYYFSLPFGSPTLST